MKEEDNSVEKNPPTKGPVNTGFRDYRGRPIRLSSAAAEAFKAMAAAAREDGIEDIGLYITSSLRDPKKNASVGGVEGSNHLTGNAFDINMLNPGPGDEWIRANGARFGFIYNSYSPNSTHFDFDSSKYNPPPKLEDNTKSRSDQPNILDNIFNNFKFNKNTNRTESISKPRSRNIASNNIIINAPSSPEPQQPIIPMQQSSGRGGSIPISDSVNSSVRTLVALADHKLG